MSRLPTPAHLQTPWRIREIAPEFRIEDVWSFRAPGAGAGDFDAMVAAVRGAGGPGSSSRATRGLFALRWRLGSLFGWDRADAGLGSRVASLSDRLPADLRGTTHGEPRDSVFTPLYRLPDELASELANRTVHTILHLGWVGGDHGYELRMTVLVRPNGLFGRLYMAAIRPFRMLVVYPAMTRQWESAWLSRAIERDRTTAWTYADVPDALRGLADPAADAVDGVTIHTSLRATPSEWAHALLQDGLGVRGQAIWRRVMRLRLARVGEERTIAGWPIVAEGTGWVRLEAASGALTAQLVIVTDEDVVTFATFVRSHRSGGRLLWATILPAHRKVSAQLLQQAAGRITARRSATTPAESTSSAHPRG
jgi:hypothetical protein